MSAFVNIGAKPKTKRAAEAARFAFQFPETLHGLQVLRGAFATARVADDLERNLLAFRETADPGALDGGNVDEHVLRAIIRLNEAVALGAVEPFHGASGHMSLPSWRCPAQYRDGASIGDLG